MPVRAVPKRDDVLSAPFKILNQQRLFAKVADEKD